MLFFWYLIKKNYKSIFKGIIPIFLIQYVLNPLYWMWDPKLTDLGYGLQFLILFSLIYVFAFFWCFYHLRNIFLDQNYKKIKLAEESVNNNKTKFDKFLDVKTYPSLQSKTQEILGEKENP